MMAGAEASELQLVEQAQRDPARFAELYELYFDRVYAFVVRRVRDRYLAEDITSETFQHALASLPKFEWRGAPFGAWLIRIAANRIADHWEKRARERGETQSIDRGEIPPDELEAADERARLFRHVRRLPAEQRLVIMSRFVQEKSIREIAQQLGKSEGAVKQLQLRALETLRERIKECNG